MSFLLFSFLKAEWVCLLLGVLLAEWANMEIVDEDSWEKSHPSGFCTQNHQVC